MDRLPTLDIATFGTPLRYRWNTNLCKKLLHFVQHRSLNEDQPLKACMPTSSEDFSIAAAGDYVQHLGIGGTDFLPSILAWRSWISERRMQRMLERGVRRRDVLKNWKRGHRVSRDGTTLLVDYSSQPDNWNQVFLGHGVYTRHEWIPFHLTHIAERLYKSDPKS